VLGTERRLSEEAALVLFRITQEALRNVWRHSGATTAGINIEFNENKTKITMRYMTNSAISAREFSDKQHGQKKQKSTYECPGTRVSVALVPD